MKKLSETDIQNMINDNWVPDYSAIRNQVKKQLHLSECIPVKQPLPQNITLDFHNKTEEQAWQEILTSIQSGVKTATVITGASGILKKKFQTWATESIISPSIESFKPLNNGSFFVKFHKRKKTDL